MDIKKGQPGRRHQYEFSLKRKVCEELLSGTIPLAELARKYNITGAGTIMRWVKWYQKEQAELYKLHTMPIAHESSEQEDTGSNNTSANFTDNVNQDELSLAKIKIAVLETLIDIAENQFNIEIRKKSGTKPL